MRRGHHGLRRRWPHGWRNDHFVGSRALWPKQSVRSAGGERCGGDVAHSIWWMVRSTLQYGTGTPLACWRDVRYRRKVQLTRCAQRPCDMNRYEGGPVDVSWVIKIENRFQRVECERNESPHDPESPTLASKWSGRSCFCEVYSVICTFHHANPILTEVMLRPGPSAQEDRSRFSTSSSTPDKRVSNLSWAATAWKKAYHRFLRSTRATYFDQSHATLQPTLAQHPIRRVVSSSTMESPKVELCALRETRYGHGR